MTKRSIINWLREFAIIVVGVFVALVAQSWWSERQERQIEREVREDIAAEFETNIRILESDLATNQAERPKMTFLQNLDGKALMAISDEQLTVAFQKSGWWAGFDPEMGNVQAMVESGSTLIVSDRAMRLKLARWTGLLELNRRFNLQATQYEQRELRPAFIRSAADGRWTPSERREMQLHLNEFLVFFDTTVENQHQLLRTAQEILALQQPKE